MAPRLRFPWFMRYREKPSKSNRSVKRPRNGTKKELKGFSAKG